MQVAFMPNHAPFVVLLFLGAAGAIATAVALFFWATWKQKPQIRRWAAIGGGVVAATYALILLASALHSGETVLAMGDRKYFCEIDCHEAYSIANVRQAATLGSGPTERKARGTFWVVGVAVEFDATTISPRRPTDAALYPNPRRIRLLDQRGTTYSPDAEGQQALESEKGHAETPFSKPLVPGESYVTEIVFDVPAEVKNPRLEITNGEAFPVPFLIGHERSPLHGKVLFGLEPRAPGHSG